MTGSALAQWRGSPNHYDGRQGLAVDHITLHIMVGSLWGTDSCFQRSSFGAASHYGVGTDGTILQWVDEDNGSWADANWMSDCSGVTIEHAGGLASIAPTDAEYEASARLCADIATRYGLGTLWHDTSGNCAGNVYLHREVPGTDHYGCPDRTTNGLDVDRIINRANQIIQGDDMTIDELFQAKGNDGRNLWDSVIQTRNELQDRAADALIKTKGNDGRNVLDSVIQARWDIAELKTMLTAQAATIETLAKAVGTNPTDIAKVVEQQVKAKLDKLQINVTATEKK